MLAEGLIKSRGQFL